MDFHPFYYNKAYWIIFNNDEDDFAYSDMFNIETKEIISLVNGE